MKKTSLMVGLIAFLILIIVIITALYYIKSDQLPSNQNNVNTRSNSSSLVVLGYDDEAFRDNWQIDEQYATEQGVKFIFIDMETGEKIPDEKITVDVDNGTRCISGGCDNFTDIFETQTNQEGVAFINFKQWPQFSFGHVNLDNWNCDGSISNYPTDQHLYFTDATEELTVECVAKNNTQLK